MGLVKVYESWSHFHAGTFQGIGPACNGSTLNRVVTQEEILQILDIHNRFKIKENINKSLKKELKIFRLRAQVANGEERRGNPGPQPPAANMMEMVWFG